MNYYYPYFTINPYNMTQPSLFSKLLGGIKGIKFSSILSGTQKTLNVVNQTIPLVKQVSPVMKNAKTMFKVMNEFKKSGTKLQYNSNSNTNQYSTVNNTNENYDEGSIIWQSHVPVFKEDTPVDISERVQLVEKTQLIWALKAFREEKIK